MSREELIRSLFEKSSRGLEIGPSYNPIAARRLGYQVDVLDHATADELRSKYKNEPNVDCDLIEDVDYVWSDRSLSETVGAVGIYDYILASHVIEHTPDIIGFLKECSLLLKPSGRLVLAVPDMRRCFDAFRPLTSLGGVLQAHTERRIRHSAATACDHVAYMAALDGRAGWGLGDEGDLRSAHSLEFAKFVYNRALTTTDYHDFHAWVFTPTSFRLLVSDLYAIGAIDLGEVSFQTTNAFEFITVLDTSKSVPRISRDIMLQQIRQELREVPWKT